MPDDSTQSILEAIARFKKIPVEKVTLESTFDELGIDSLDGMEFFFEIEEEFDIDIPDEQLRSLRTVREAVDGIKSLMAAKPLA